TCAFAAGLRRELLGGFGATMLPLFHVFSAIGMLLLGVFIHEPEHTYACIATFVPMLICFLLFARRFADDNRWDGWATYTLLSVIFMAALIVLYWATSNLDNSYAGIFEHLFVMTRLVWMILFVMTLLDGRRLTPVGMDV
ncbi:MAG: DUF998 domain-containing protein, partial [Mucilaginibacter sp.]